MNSNRLYTGIYLGISVLNLGAILFSKLLPGNIFKPLIMLSLWFWAVLEKDARVVRRKWVFLIGLLMAMLGDIFLMYAGYFLHGLAAFLVMQLLYIATFLPEISFRQPTQTLMIRALFMVIVLTLILTIILPNLTDPVLKVAVSLYALVITLMTFCASIRDAGVSSISYQYVLTGAILFMISDTLIAYNKFVESVPQAGLWIMSTYMAAQYAIVKGVLKSP